MRKNIAAIIFDAQAAYPAIKDLDGVSTGTYLLGGILGGYRDQLLHQFVPRGGRGVHHLLGEKIVARTSTFDHVTREREGRAAESDNGKLVTEMLAHDLHSFGNIAEVGGAIGAQL